MISKEKTVYPSFCLSYSDKELVSLFHPNQDELNFIAQFSHNKQTQCILLSLLKTHQYLGYFPQLTSIPILNYFKQVLNLPIKIKLHCSPRYLRQIKLYVLEYLEVKIFSKKEEEKLLYFLKGCACTMADPTDLINAGITELLRNHYSLPSFEVLERLVLSSRHQAHQEIYQNIERRLSDNEKEILQQLFFVKEEEFITPFTKIKSHPNTAKFSHIQEWKNRFIWLKSLLNTSNIFNDISFTKIQQFATQAQALEVSQMLAFTNKSKCLTLLVSLIHLKKMETKDDLVLMFIRKIKSLHNQGKKKLDCIQKEQKQEEEKMFKMAYQVAESGLEKENDADLGRKVREILTNYGGAEYIVDSYKIASKYHGQNHYSLLWKLHARSRKTLWEIIDLLDIQSATENNDLLASLKLFKEFKNSKKRNIEGVCFPLSFASQKWRNMIVKTDTYDRQLLEICLFSYLSEDLQSTDLFISDSLKYADYRTYLLSMEECKAELSAYCQTIEVSDQPSEFIHKLQEKLHEKSTMLDQKFEEQIQEKPTLTKVKKEKDIPDHIIDFQKKVTQKLPQHNLLDVLNRVNQWVKYTDHFYPIMGGQAKSSQALSNYLFTIFAYGTNIGPTQLEKHTNHPVTRRMLQRVNYQHIDAQKLQTALVDIVNQYNSFDLIHYWGDVSSMVADGTHIELTENNLLGERHIRYGGYGGIAYHHISDTYVALFSHFIACGVWEAVYILDGLLSNQSDIKPDKIHADTQGQNEPAFGLSYLLGIDLMPRIRNWKSLNLYKIDEGTFYPNIDVLFSKTIDWELIEIHWYDLMQVVISIHKGKVLPSIILQKLGIHGRKTKLYKAFRELGRVTRTLFLLDYIHDQDFQQTIHQATTKVESYNSFCDWITFGGQKIRTGDPVEQEKRVKYTSLIANAVMLNNVHDLTQAILEIQKEGNLITPEMISSLSPYKNEHLRIYGEFVLNLEKNYQPIIKRNLK